MQIFISHDFQNSAFKYQVQELAAIKRISQQERSAGCCRTRCASIPYAGCPFIALIFIQRRNVYQIWLETKLVNAVFRRLSNVKYGSACGGNLLVGCWTRARPPLVGDTTTARPFTLKLKREQNCRLPLLFRRWLLLAKFCPFSWTGFMAIVDWNT